MSKRIKIYSGVWLILFAVFQVVCFVTPAEIAGMSKFSGAFWVGYVFIDLAFILQYVCTYKALKEENTQKLFYKLPLIRISYTGLVLMAVLGSLAMAIPDLPYWIGAIVCLLILAFTAIAAIKASAAADLVADIDEMVTEKTLFIKMLTVDAENLLARAGNGSIKDTVQKVYEAVRYSDPVSHSALAEIEAQITVRFSALLDAVNANDDETAKNVANELIVLMDDRNKKCKLVK